MDKADFNKDKRDRLRAANEEIAAEWSETRQGEPKVNIDPDKSGLADITAAGPSQEKPVAALPPEDPGKESPSTCSTANQTASGLMSQYGKPLPEDPGRARDDSQRSDRAAYTDRQLAGRYGRATRMANIYKKHGLLAEMLPWMNKAYAAKKQRIPDALHLLLNEDAKGAREALRTGGISLTEDPVPAEKSDPLITGNLDLKMAVRRTSI